MQLESKIRLLLGFFIGLLVGMNFLGSKIINLPGIATSVGIFMAPFTFLITDIVEEVCGKKVTRDFVKVGVITLVVVFIYTAIFVRLAPAERFTFDAEYKIIFGSSLRIMFASIVAFALAQIHDIWAFNFWKTKTHGKFLWLRNNLSTMVSQAIDTLVFMFIAFYHLAPKFDALFVLQLALPYYLLKIIFAALDTPFVYLGVRWLRGSSSEQSKI
ncbi:MAG: queuosine precursor transporter [Patescibacteria group bacterium]